MLEGAVLFEKADVNEVSVPGRWLRVLRKLATCCHVLLSTRLPHKHQAFFTRPAPRRHDFSADCSTANSESSFDPSPETPATANNKGAKPQPKVLLLPSTSHRSERSSCRQGHLFWKLWDAAIGFCQFLSLGLRHWLTLALKGLTF